MILLIFYKILFVEYSDVFSEVMLTWHIFENYSNYDHFYNRSDVEYKWPYSKDQRYYIFRREYTDHRPQGTVPVHFVTTVRFRYFHNDSNKN